MTRKEFFAVGVAEEWAKIPDAEGGQWAKIAKMMLSKNWTACDKRRDKDS